MATQISENVKLVYGRELNKAQYSKLEYRTGGNVMDEGATQLGIAENPSFGIDKDYVDDVNIPALPTAENATVTASSEEVTYGEEVTLTVEPNEGYHFVEWEDGVKDNSRSFVVDDTLTKFPSFTVAEDEEETPEPGE